MALFDVFSATRWRGGRGLDYGKNDWKKWNFDSSTMGKISWKNEKKSEIFGLITWISYEKSIISVVSWNRLCVQKKFKNVLMGILMMIFSTKIEKRKIFESLIHGDFNIFFQKKKWKMNIFYMCLEIIHMQIWILFFTKIKKMKIYYTSWKFSHIGVLTIFKKKTEKWMLDTYVEVWRKHSKRNIWPMKNMRCSTLLTAQKYFSKLTLRKS